MITHTKPLTRKRKVDVKTTAKEGSGFINNLINKLPFELHIPGYNYCGPGTKLEKRLLRNDKGINPLDEACKQHDIAYSQNQSLEARHRADLELAAAADRRWRESSSVGEKIAGFAVNKIMKFKVKRGMGVPISRVIKATRKALRKQQKHISKGNSSQKHLINAAVKAAKLFTRGKTIKHSTRVIPLPKRGGFLPLLPILGALAAAGTIAGGVSTTARNIYEMTRKKNNEGVVAEKVVGKGLYVRPYKSGMGLYITPKN